jgi:ABC-type polysaccharide/polyol phosphate export permease
VLALNPLTALVQAHRDVLLYGTTPSAAVAAQIAAVSIAIFAVGAWIFARARGEFADLV